MTSPPARPTASILIPSHRGASYLDVALATLMGQATDAGAEVIVISDGPDADIAAVTERHGARLVTLPVQRGLNSGRNAGIASARSDRIIFIDQDIAAPAGWLTAWLDGFDAYPDAEVFGGPIRARLEGGPRSCGREPAPITTLDAGTTDCDVPLVWGANMGMRRSAFDSIGLFDEQLLGRGDEEEWEMRWTASGGRIRYLAAAVIDHRRAPADSRLAVLARAAYGQGREVRRHDRRAGKPRSWQVEGRVLLGCLWHTIVRRCGYGVVMGAKSAGSLREMATERRR